MDGAAAAIALLLLAAHLGAALLLGELAFGAPRPRTLQVAGLLLAVASLALVPAAAAAMGGSPDAARDPGALLAVLAGTPLGWAALARAPLALLAGLGPARLGRGRLLAAGLAAASLAVGGHASADPGPLASLRLAALALHGLAGAAWVGAVCVFARDLLGPDAPARAARLVRFSGWGALLVAGLLAGGLVSAGLALGPAPLAELPASGWGRTLIAKAVLLLAMLGLAALNGLVLAPRLRGRPAGRALGPVRASLVLEAGLGTAALALAALLGRLPPPG